MHIGIISNSDAFIPLAYTLATQRLQVYIFYSPSQDTYANQKVAGFIQQTKIPFTEENDTDSDLYKWLKNSNHDVCFILGYPRLIQLSKLKNCITKLYNIHFGPLPSFKGPAPVFWQLKKGGDKLGLAIHQLTAKLDDGPVVWLKETDNLSHYNYQSVNTLFSQLCVEGVIHILRIVTTGFAIPIIEINRIKHAYYKRPVLQDVLINWQQMSANEICNLIRACNPWNKGAVTFYNKQELKLMDAIIINDKIAKDTTAGTIVEDENFLQIACVDGKIINVNTLYYNDCFIPAYQGVIWGFTKGKMLAG